MLELVCAHDGQLSLDTHTHKKPGFGSETFMTICPHAQEHRCVSAHICAACMSSVGQSASRIILYGSSVCLTLMHFPVACLHSLAGVLCVSEARAGAESLMDGVQGSRTSAVVGHIAARRNRTRSPWVCTRVHGAFCCVSFFFFFFIVGAIGKQRGPGGDI